MEEFIQNIEKILMDEKLLASDRIEVLKFMFERKHRAEKKQRKNLGERSEPPTRCCAKYADLQKAYAQQLINYLELFAEKEPELWEAIKIENKETIKEVIKKLENVRRNR